MADVQSATAEIRHGKKKKEEETTGQKYNGVPYSIGDHKNYAKKLPFRCHRTNYLAISLQLRHLSTIGKHLLNSSISSTCLRNMANFSPLVAKIGSEVLGTPANFNGFHFLP